MQPTPVTITRDIFHLGRLCARKGEEGLLFEIFTIPRKNPKLGWPFVGRVQTPQESRRSA